MKQLLLKRVLIMALCACMAGAFLGMLPSIGVAHAAYVPPHGGGDACGAGGGCNEGRLYYHGSGGCGQTQVTIDSYGANNGYGDEFCFYFLSANTWGSLDLSYQSPGILTNVHALSDPFAGAGYVVTNNSIITFHSGSYLDLGGATVTFIHLDGCASWANCDY